MREPLFVLGTGIGHSGEAEALIRKNGEFRKATRNMTLAYLSLHEALREAGIEPSALPGFGQGFSMILGSSHGELGTTVDFLRTLADTRVARPLLFQNSLHNSTLGFLTVKSAFTGPSLTLSNGAFTGEDCLLAASDLISQESCLACIVTTADFLPEPPELREAISRTHPVGTRISEGAATLVVAGETGVSRLGARPLARIDSIRFERRKRALSTSELESEVNPYYDSNGVERLCRTIRDRCFGTGFLLKPDGQRSSIDLEPFQNKAPGRP